MPMDWGTANPQRRAVMLVRLLRELLGVSYEELLSNICKTAARIGLPAAVLVIYSVLSF